MTDVTVSVMEDKLDELYLEYKNSLKKVVEYLREKQDENNSQDLLNEFHSKGVEYFNCFERTIDEYGLPEISLNKDVKTRKVEDTINIIETILKHWKTIEVFCNKFNLIKPKPSRTAYASIQRVIKKFKPDIVLELKEEFNEIGLPTYGFDDENKHSGWKRNYVTHQLIVGVILLLVSGILIFKIESLTGFQYLFLRLILSLGITSVGVSLFEGFLKISWDMKTSLVIRISIWVFLFLLIYYFNPPIPII